MKYIHRKIFPSPLNKSDGILTQLWYNYNKETQLISIEDFTVHFVINNKVGKNVESICSLTMIYIQKW